MNSAVLLFLARILLLLLLYLFLYLVVQALRQDLRVAVKRAPPADASPLQPRSNGRQAVPALGLELVEAGQTALPAGERFPLHDPFVLGRGANSDVTLDDDWISAKHVRLRYANGTWLAEDMGSTNGTRVNGQPLTGAVRVQPGDELDLGRVKFKLVEAP